MHFHHWIDCHGVAFSKELLEWGRIFSGFAGRGGGGGGGEEYSSKKGFWVLKVQNDLRYKNESKVRVLHSV